MTHTFPAWDFAADTYLLELERLQNKSFRTIGNFSSHMSTRELRVAFKISYVYDFITQLCRQHAKIIQDHINATVCNTGQGEATHISIRGLNLAVVRLKTVQVIKLSL
jgi:hypothetical protein